MRLGVNYPHGPLAWGERLGGGAATAGELATPLWRGAIAPVAPEDADGEAP
ncbi:hypothetical protein [Klebsiella pneumoniae]|uniref:hypothetical protein n=1 Tax=Klebsiella pneumoniae TaxID=573 RepID=UPI002265F7C8|nr:hypothetical protein [Klebsiella pneumoniae]